MLVRVSNVEPIWNDIKAQRAKRDGSAGRGCGRGEKLSNLIGVQGNFLNGPLTTVGFME